MLFLIFILLVILLLPLCSRTIERQLESFLLCSGIIAVIWSGQLSLPFIKEALQTPLIITLAVFCASILFALAHPLLIRIVLFWDRRLPRKLFLALFPIILGLLSSVITAIIAAFILATIVPMLRLEKTAATRFAILNCFAIGLGAVLTPIGEPLATITTAQLNVPFHFLFYLLSPTVIPFLIFISVIVYFFMPTKATPKTQEPVQQSSFIWTAVTRSFKIYLFVLALHLLGASFEPFATTYLVHLTPSTLYWLNTISAILDNATLAAAEMTSALPLDSVKAILIGLLLSGGMLIPGNIPNIIIAKQLNISSSDWAKFGLPFGFLLMTLYYIVMQFGG